MHGKAWPPLPPPLQDAVLATVGSVTASKEVEPRAFRCPWTCGDQGIGCGGRGAAAPIARTAMRTASRRTGRMCSSCSDMIDSSIPSWGVDERVVSPGMEPVHQPLQTDLQALEAGEARRKDQVDLREDTPDTLSKTAGERGHPRSQDGGTPRPKHETGSVRVEEKH